MKSLIRPVTTLICICLLALAPARSAKAAILLTFEDLSPGNITNSYGGIQWHNFEVAGVLNPGVPPGIPGITSNNVAINSSGGPASISCAPPFDLISASLTAMSVDGLAVEVQGFAGGTMIYDQINVLSTNQSSKIIFNFTGADQIIFIASPAGEFTLDNVGLGGATVDPAKAFANTLALPIHVLHNFSGLNSEYPKSGLLRAADGNFYGTTYRGGDYGVGTVFRLGADGTFATLASFNNTNGADPTATLVPGPNGSFYGTTYYGGRYNRGTVFKISAAGDLSTLVHFNGTNGATPYRALSVGNDGNFYGTTIDGGDYGQGSVFKMTPLGVLTPVAAFEGVGGISPRGRLLLGGDGNFYGTTANGGQNGQGTVYRVTTNGALTVLANFNLNNGSSPDAGLTAAGDGNFYGSTHASGPFDFGTLFRVTTNGTLTTLFRFGGTNGANPMGSLILGEDGYLYGTTVQGGANGSSTGVGPGNIFRMATDGTLTILASFNTTNGAYLDTELTFGGEGSLYGTTVLGGGANAGTVFRLDLPPGIKVQPVPLATAPTTNVSFTVTATGTRPFAYQWMKNGMPLTEDGNCHGVHSNTLILSRGRANDGANLSVVITNCAGSVTSSPVTLPTPGDYPSANRPLLVWNTGPGAFALSGLGNPNAQWQVSFATNFTGPWFPLSTNVVADANGIWSLLDSSATNTQRFYQITSH